MSEIDSATSSSSTSVPTEPSFVTPSVKLSAVERKFMQQLCAYSGQTAAIEQIQPNPKTSVAERDRICRRLHRLGLVDYSTEVTRFCITPLGKAMLKLDCPRSCLPITPDERAILLLCRYQTITPQTLALLRLSSPEQAQQMIQHLASRRLVKIVEAAIVQVSAISNLIENP